MCVRWLLAVMRLTGSCRSGRRRREEVEKRERGKRQGRKGWKASSEIRFDAMRMGGMEWNRPDEERRCGRGGVEGYLSCSSLGCLGRRGALTTTDDGRLTTHGAVRAVEQRPRSGGKGARLAGRDAQMGVAGVARAVGLGTRAVSEWSLQAWRLAD